MRTPKGPQLVELVYKFTRKFLTFAVTLDGSERKEVEITIHLHLFPFEQRFFMDMSDSFDVKNNMVLFMQPNCMGNIRANVEEMQDWVDLVNEVLAFAKDQLYSFTQSQVQVQ